MDEATLFVLTQTLWGPGFQNLEGVAPYEIVKFTDYLWDRLLMWHCTEAALFELFKKTLQAADTMEAYHARFAKLDEIGRYHLLALMPGITGEQYYVQPEGNQHLLELPSGYEKYRKCQRAFAQPEPVRGSLRYYARNFYGTLDIATRRAEAKEADPRAWMSLGAAYLGILAAAPNTNREARDGANAELTYRLLTHWCEIGK